MVPPAPPSASSGCGVTTRTGFICSIRSLLLSVSTRVSSHKGKGPLTLTLSRWEGPPLMRRPSADAVAGRGNSCNDIASPRCCRRRRKSFLQRCRRLSDGQFALIEHRRHAEKAVNHAVVTAIGRRYTGFLEALGIGSALIAQRITLGRNHQRWRQTTELPGHQRSSIGIIGVSSLLEIMIPVPLHAGTGEHVALRKALIGIGRIVAVRHWINEQLEGQ